MTPNEPHRLGLPSPRDTLALLPRAFQMEMGLHPLDLAEWIDVDDRLSAELAEKRRPDPAAASAADYRLTRPLLGLGAPHRG